MDTEEKKRLNTKWAVWHCPLDKIRKKNIPKSIVSPHFETREVAEEYLEEHYPARGRYEYGVFETDGQTGSY